VGRLDTGLKFKEITSKYGNGFLEKSCKDFYITRWFKYDRDKL
jgi:hypothetical protein